MEDPHQRLRVVVADEHGRRLRATWLVAWLRRIAPAAARGTVSIAIVSDARMRTLNRDYRGKDYATDVLSFSPDSSSPPRRTRTTRRKIGSASSAVSPVHRFLGEVVIARGVARRQAREAGHSERDEVRLLALHGLLHLLGYDHERDDGRMQRVEARLRRKGGLLEGLIERAAGS
jgi:probable rRNA maturation factor